MSGEFPYLHEHETFDFPPPESGTSDGIVGIGGNLSPGMLLSAYRQGIFPWYSHGDPILWWCPDPRFVLCPAELHVPRRLQRLLRNDPFSYRFDTRFGEVLCACRDAPRPGQQGTWITEEIMQGYTRLHRLGYAHSLEVLVDGELAGGLYGVALGRVFFGESMFARRDDASKAGFVRLAQLLHRCGYGLIDCQVYTGHLERFGAAEMRRDRFLHSLQRLVHQPTHYGSWSSMSVLETAVADKLAQN
ncbi:MAG: leucyl/phenylalanyl-tRNA--protein transferase [Spirochaetaceae bacterium]|nr:MAG: leucyl/phenylalanyl-tRNA--protein transferase [Spirochaetaceae bacterium]